MTLPVDTMDVAALRPCPFCGSSVDVVNSHQGYYTVRCADADCPLSVRVDCSNRGELAAWWNRRAPEPETAALREEVARLRGALEEIASKDVEDGYCDACGFDSGDGEPGEHFPGCLAAIASAALRALAASPGGEVTSGR